MALYRYLHNGLSRAETVVKSLRYQELNEVAYVVPRLNCAGGLGLDQTMQSWQAYCADNQQQCSCGDSSVSSILRVINELRMGYSLRQRVELNGFGQSLAA